MLLDGYISSGRFCTFLNGFIEITNEDQVYDVWKHRVYDRNYSDFREEALPKSATPKNRKSTDEIIADSFAVVERLNELRRENNGAV